MEAGGIIRIENLRRSVARTRVTRFREESCSPRKIRISKEGRVYVSELCGSVLSHPLPESHEENLKCCTCPQYCGSRSAYCGASSSRSARYFSHGGISLPADFVDLWCLSPAATVTTKTGTRVRHEHRYALLIRTLSYIPYTSTILYDPNYSTRFGWPKSSTSSIAAICNKAPLLHHHYQTFHAPFSRQLIEDLTRSLTEGLVALTGSNLSSRQLLAMFLDTTGTTHCRNGIRSQNTQVLKRKISATGQAMASHGPHPATKTINSCSERHPFRLSRIYCVETLDIRELGLAK